MRVTLSESGGSRGDREGAGWAMSALAIATAFCAALGAQSADDLDHLFQAHQWFELRSAVTDRSPSLMRASVATAFNDPETAERLLRDIIRSAPASNTADEAYALLSQIYLRSGQYRRWLTSYRQWVAAIPDSARARAEEEDEKKFAGRPDQVNGRPRRALLRHDSDNSGYFTIPVSIDGKADDFLFDTGAWQSAMTARAAARLGLKIDATHRVLRGSSGQSAGFRTAIAKDVQIGDIHFRNVSFAVIEGSGPIAEADVGIVGMPILLALGAIRWSPDGTVEIGSTAPRVRADANLVFDRNRLLLRTRVFGRDVLTILDTGANTTDLNANFADTFPQVVQGAKKGSTDITGVGGTQTFDSLEIPEVIFEIGPAVVPLRPATISLQRIGLIGGECCVGNAGGDLLKEAGFTIDFSAMTLRLSDAKD
jgi:clan AA aspartic protease (TIGR02281 family)